MATTVRPAVTRWVGHAWLLRAPAAALATAAVITLAACGSAESSGPSETASGSSAFKPASQQPGSPITVWVDSTRLPAAQAYQKAHPDVKLKIVTYSGDATGAADLQTKIELYDKAGSGWPDVVFSEQENDATWSASGATAWTAPLSQGLVPQATLDGFATGALGVCTYGGKVYCLRNDLAQDVLWYNAKLMKQFGYTVPTTWQQYEALGAKVARQHPGYIIGGAGDSSAADIYMAASQCPAQQVSGNTITVNTASPNCTRMASLLDAGIAGKWLATLAVSSSDYLKKYAGKTLMMPGPSWYGQYVFADAFKVPAGQVAAAPPLKWAGQASTATGDVGGGIWMVSEHSKNLAAAASFVTAMTTDNSIQTAAPTYPAYKPAAAAWLAHQAKAGYFASDVSSAFQVAAGEVWPDWSATRFSSEAIWSSVMTPGITSGKTITSLLGAWQTAIENQAKVSGYTVTTG